MDRIRSTLNSDQSFLDRAELNEVAERQSETQVETKSLQVPKEQE